MSFKFASHPEVHGMHAFLSASKYHWIRYDDEKILETFSTAMLAALGTRKHDFAKEAIELGIKMPDNGQTLSMYVNDALGFRMNPEQILFYSPNCFGTADAVSFRRERDGDPFTLRIHDLKTGTSKASVNQLEIYAALFCLEYDVKPHEILMELRIYQNDYVQVYIPDPEDILHIMNKIMHFDRLIDEARREALS